MYSAAPPFLITSEPRYVSCQTPLSPLLLQWMVGCSHSHAQFRFSNVNSKSCLVSYRFIWSSFLWSWFQWLDGRAMSLASSCSIIIMSHLSPVLVSFIACVIIQLVIETPTITQPCFTTVSLLLLERLYVSLHIWLQTSWYALLRQGCCMSHQCKTSRPAWRTLMGHNRNSLASTTSPGGCRMESKAFI